jgi:hypothetical protein
MVGGFFQLLQERAPADDAAHPFLIERRIASTARMKLPSYFLMVPE